MPVWFDRLIGSKRWGRDSAVENPSDSEANTGFNFLGPVFPSAELHDALFQYKDDVDIYLFQLMKKILTEASVTAAYNDDSSLLTALSYLITPRAAILTNTGNFVVPANVRFLRRVRIWGGGGGGAGSANTAGINYAGSGAAAGSYAELIRVPVTPGATLPYVIGAAGVGGPALSPGSAGGSSSFNGVVTAPGGNGGSYQSANATTQTSGGTPTGGSINLQGGAGSIVLPGVSGNAIGGAGGSSPQGGLGGVYSTDLASPGQFPGGGGGGGGGFGGVNGGNGAKGLIIVEY